MSKKIMKRSLALGALMAFVITGSAMAADYEGQTFENLSMGYYSGAFGDVQSGAITIKNCTFANNEAVNETKGFAYGGAIYVDGDLTVEGSTFTGNVAKTAGGTKLAHGGAIKLMDGTLQVDSCIFNGNKVVNSTGNDSYGSAIYVSNNTEEMNATVSITNSKFLNQEGGRAIYLNSESENKTTATLSGNTFEGNKRGCVQTEAATASVTFEGENILINNGGDAIKNKGTTNFAVGSTTIFSGNELDIDNQTNAVININKDSIVSIGSGIKGAGTTNINAGTLEIGADSEIGTLDGDNGTLKFLDKVKVNVTTNNTSNLTLAASGKANDAVNGDAAELLKGFNLNGKENKQMVLEEGLIQGEKVVELHLEKDDAGNVKGVNVAKVLSEKVNSLSNAVSDAGMALKGHWRAHMNDMNKRMGDLRMANGETGVWTRMVRGESEYQGATMQYNQYQLGYDEKLSVDKRWTVGAAVTFSEGDSSYGSGSTDDKSTAFAIYGSKLNNDGTFIDLIARYARLESDLEDRNYGTGDYEANGYSVSAEFGKRIEQGNGLWIEPQVELTYGTVDSADIVLGNKYKAHYDSLDSFIARAGFALGKDIKQGNVYARASYLYDFDGETETQFAGGKAIEEDFGGGWWEVGVGANINLSKATYIYADVEKTFGGEVDTNWQWNLGVRYSF